MEYEDEIKQCIADVKTSLSELYKIREKMREVMDDLDNFRKEMFEKHRDYEMKNDDKS